LNSISLKTVALNARLESGLWRASESWAGATPDPEGVAVKILQKACAFVDRKPANDTIARKLCSLNQINLIVEREY
jgi:hypothetical protein